MFCFVWLYHGEHVLGEVPDIVDDEGRTVPDETATRPELGRGHHFVQLPHEGCDGIVARGWHGGGRGLVAEALGEMAGERGAQEIALCAKTEL